QILFVLLYLFAIPFMQAQDISFNPEVMEDELELAIQEKPNQYFRAYIILQDQVDIEGMRRQFDVLRASKQERGVLVVKALEQKAANTQGRFLQEFQRNPAVISSTITPYWITNMIEIEAKGHYLAELSLRSDIQRIEQVVMEHIFKYDRAANPAPVIVDGREPSLTIINAHKLWALGYTGYGTKLMVIDQDTDFRHRSLHTQFLYHNEPLDEVYTAENPLMECLEHGTSVTGSAIGIDRRNNDTIGPAFNAKYLIGPIETTNAEGVTCRMVGRHLSSIGNLQFALNPDRNSNTSNDIPDVINNSYGRELLRSSDCQNVSLRSVLLSLDAAGVSVLYSAGNNGPEGGSLTLQASLNFDLYVPLIIGATDGNRSVAEWSSRGPSPCIDGPNQFKPDLVAPGEFVRSATPNNGFDVVSGSSFSTPYVSGAILLLKEAFPNLSGRILNQALLETARDLGDTGDDNTYGAGLVDAFAAYQWLIEQGNTPTPAIQSTNDAIIVDVQSRSIDCNRMIQPLVSIANNGTEVLTELSFQLRDTDNDVNMGRSTWTGKIEPGQTKTFELEGVNAIVGNYTVQLQLDRVNGKADLRFLDNFFKFDVDVSPESILPIISIEGDEICRGGQSMIRADAGQAGGTIRWYDTRLSGNIIAEGPMLLLEDIQSDTTVYVSVTTLDKVGLERADAGPNTFLSQRAGIVFDAIAPFTLKSVKVFAEVSGLRIFQLVSENGEIQQATVNLREAGEQRVDLGFDVQIGNNYELLMTLGNGLAVTTNGTNFPYEITGVARINRSTGTVANFYSYFYDWEVEYDYFCGRVFASIQVNEDGEAPDVDFSVDNPVVMLDDQGQA
ncbi:MAG: S8 family serine peptidase, partial [Bacteroidota bacterium]